MRDVCIEIPKEINGFDKFGHIPLAKAHNTRDLGGMPAKDGKAIAKKKLVRSGELSGIADGDAYIMLFHEKVSCIVDFRTNTEAGAAPLDKDIASHVEYHHLPVFSGSAMGITRSKNLLDNLKEARVLAKDVRSTVKGTYAEAITGQLGQQAYRKFFEILMQERQGAVLWNCSAGKDRTGIASILLESALGVDAEHIRADYLATNIFSKKRNEKLPYRLARPLARLGLDITPMFYVYNEYFDSLMATFDEQFGGIDAYLADVLGVGANEKQHLQELYLV